MDYRFIRKHCAKVAKQLFDDFDKRKSTWADVAKEFYPLGVAGLTKNVEHLADECYMDDKAKLHTTMPIDCLRKGAAGFHGNLTSPLRRWFRFRLPAFMTPDGKTTHEQRNALDRLTKATEWVMSRSAIYASLYKLYEQLLCFGFSAMIINADPERIIRCQTLRIGTYALGIGPDGMVCRLVRRFSWTAEQIIAEFGDDGVDDEIKKAAADGNIERRWTVYNIIEPNAVGPKRKYDKVSEALGLGDEMIYRSVYWLEKATDATPNSGVLKVAGFTIEPIVAPRFDYELGDTYGRGRGVDGLTLARGVQTFRNDILRTSANRVQPAVIASAEFKDEGLKLGRGAVNYTRFGEQSGGTVVPVFPNPPDSQDTRLSFQDALVELQDLFFNSAFATIDALKNNAGVKTATEVDALVRENMERLGAVITNLDKELLDPLVSIVAKYTLQSGIGLLSEEDIAQFGNLNVEYVSQIHLAQKQSSISAVQNWTAFIGQLAQFKPDALYKISTNGVIDEYGDMIGVPEQCVATDEQVEAAAQAQAKAQAQQEQMMQMQAQAKAMRDMGSIPVTDETAAGQMLRATTQR
ncbi:MAG: portal protein [Bacteroidales bacterium]|nr:portal protein [Bacteroidales bacterium]